MSKCRYDLSEDCHNKDCLNCVLDKIRAEIESYVSEEPHQLMSKATVLEIIDKYRKEQEKGE